MIVLLYASSIGLHAQNGPPQDGNDPPPKSTVVAKVKPMQIGGSVKPPTFLHDQKAAIVHKSEKKFEGDVLVSLWVDEQGIPSHVHVEQGVGHGYDEDAVATVQGYRFSPATKKGKPVLVEMVISVHFKTQ